MSETGRVDCQREINRSIIGLLLILLEIAIPVLKAETVRLSSKGQLVIPRAIREALHWEPGTELTVAPAGNGLLIQLKRKKGNKRLEDLRGCIKYSGPPITDEVLQAPVDYRKDWEESEKRSR